jgi:hypothetical protein
MPPLARRISAPLANARAANDSRKRIVLRDSELAAVQLLAPS